MTIDRIMECVDVYAQANERGVKAHEARQKCAQAIADALQCGVHEEARALCASLSPRQRETLIFSAKGIPSKQCAEILGVSRMTADNYRGQVRKKLGVSTLIEAAVVAAKAGIV
jgi:DNA-binding CsgD family transcriptional regulator